MHNRIRDRLISNCTAVYKDGGFTEVVKRLNTICKGDKDGFVQSLSAFKKHMEVRYGSTQ